MKRTGKLQITGTESRLDDGTLLARCNETNPIGAGTAFLKNKGLKDGDNIWVSGNDGKVGDVDVFCMDDAGRQGPSLAAAPDAEMLVEKTLKKQSKRKPAKKVPKEKRPVRKGLRKKGKS